ncbi:MAG TPA: DUF5615 family PIN-like protein [Candidatus Ozemobacteraceae bacterium]|nr:DUF5615 family PIN-like protein [Candidatus Ozemobacteraceae bacterium]
MKFLANENIPLASIKLLRQAGFTVDAIVEDSPGVSDEEVLLRANREASVILTFDRDYGELVFRKKMALPAGLVYFRMTPKSPDEIANILLWVINSQIPMLEKFTIVERDRIRQRPF